MSEIWIDIDTKKESRYYRLRESVQRQVAIRQISELSPFPGIELFLNKQLSFQLLVPSRRGQVMNLCPRKAGQLGHRDLSTVCLLIS